MKIVALSGSNVGTKTRTVMDYVAQAVMAQDPDIEVTLIDLAEADMVFSMCVRVGNVWRGFE